MYLGVTQHPPKRRTRKRIAADFGEIPDRAGRRRFEEQMRLYELGAELARSLRTWPRVAARSS
jgi:hypothetical protein